MIENKEYFIKNLIIFINKIGNFLLNKDILSSQNIISFKNIFYRYFFFKDLFKENKNEIKYIKLNSIILKCNIELYN